ncbi:hypothetical protein JTE90_008610 [Oedothorax gibbosus]|uniref:C2H2-type domain-containing protein n=1 Tax=Oedothorax gibbosus TaxID=931172 RepID=A0AAV6UEW6_9ARAC|nr:hypothetical protein JTE90_008610 [Oedothorax gibbosus]
MSVVQVVAHITPLNSVPSSSPNLLTTSQLGDPISVETRVITDPRNGLQYTMETAIIVKKYSEASDGSVEAECEGIPGLVCAPLSCPMLGKIRAGEENKCANLSLPYSICRENIPQLAAPESEKTQKLKVKFNLKSVVRKGPQGKESFETDNLGNEMDEPSASAKKTGRDLVKGLMRYIIEGECLICGLVDLGMNTAQHLSEHISKNSYRCTCHHLPFHTPRSLYVHMLNKCDTYLYTCEVCGTRYQRKHLLTVHELKNHTELAAPFEASEEVFRQNVPSCYSCSSCGDRLTLMDDINLHQDLHGRETTFQCLFCGRRFAELGALQSHVHVRVVAKKFACKVCTEEFSSTRALQVHQVSHTKDPWVCTMCGDKKFYFEKTYVKHMKLIHGIN